MRQKTKKIIFYGAWLIRFSFLMLLYLIISLPLRFDWRYKDLWLIAERPEEARDNGYWLYKWILENKPKTNVRFVLSRQSVDYNKMPRKDLIIEPGSAKHYIYYILSSYSVSTHMHGACPGKSFCIPFLFLVRKKKTVFLQHGVVKDKIKLRGGLDIIIASSDEEKELIVEANPRYVGKVFVTGLCRYDSLEDVSKGSKIKTVLVMPTFRKWLRDVGRLKSADQVFMQTDYYKSWNSFLTDSHVIKLLNNNNMRLVFFPHNEMQLLAHNFVSQNDRVIIGKKGEYDVQALLKESSILITDYSSVLFDFAYMKKPVVFYQFDQKDFYKKHYASSGKKYLFGKTVTREGELVNELSNIISSGCIMSAKLKKDVDSFFKYRDFGNCERNYNCIIRSKK